jgi:hypothetical protein
MVTGYPPTVFGEQLQSTFEYALHLYGQNDRQARKKIAASISKTVEFLMVRYEPGTQDHKEFAKMARQLGADISTPQKMRASLTSQLHRAMDKAKDASRLMLLYWGDIKSPIYSTVVFDQRLPALSKLDQMGKLRPDQFFASEFLYWQRMLGSFLPR